jgi:hypothetical protein
MERLRHCGINAEFQREVQKHRIEHKRLETEQPNQNPAESVTREVRNDGIGQSSKRIVQAIMRMTASQTGRLQGRTPKEAVTGETPDSSEHLDFGFCCWVWFKRDAGIGEIEIGNFLGVSLSTGSLMSCFVLPSSGIPDSCTTVQRMTELEKQTDANRQRMTDFEKGIADWHKEGRLHSCGDKPDLEQWFELLETDPHFAQEFAQTFDNPDVKEADDEFDPDSYDSYLNMEIAVDRDGHEPQLARVSTKCVKDNAGNPIGQANDNPILDVRLCEV